MGAEGHYQNVCGAACKLDYSLFPMAKLTRCVFEKCDLTQVTFEGAIASHVAFRDCNLTGARFIRSRLSDVDMRGSRIDGLEINTEDLTGLRIDIVANPGDRGPHRRGESGRAERPRTRTMAPLLTRTARDGHTISN